MTTMNATDIAIADLERLAVTLDPERLRELAAGALEQKLAQLLLDYYRLRPVRDAEPDVFDNTDLALELLKQSLRLSLADRRRVNAVVDLLNRREQEVLHPDGLAGGAA